MSEIVLNFILKTGKEYELPGKPSSIEPLVFSPSLLPQEVAATEDTGRVFIGHIPVVGDINYQRTEFPYQNIELLTEASPRLNELFSQFNRFKTEESFFLPTDLLATSSLSNVEYSNYSGNMIPSKFYGENISVEVEYHAFATVSGVNYPLQQGTIQIICSPGNVAIQDYNTFVGLGSQLFFDISSQQSDSFGSYYQLMYTNDTGQTVKFYMKRTIIKSTL